MKNLYNKYKYILFTLIGAISIITIIYYLNNITPLGNNSLLAVDFYHQYGPMLGELYDRVKNGSNLIYSFNMGMGLPFFRNYFNYLSSLFNIIIFLVNRKDLLTSYSFIIAIKTITSACTMYYYLSKKFNKNNFPLCALSILYAFNSYFIAYYWNIMWLDGLVYLPLITLGIEKIINQNKGLLYIIALALMLYSNYFIGYMICIFSVLYFIIYLFIKGKTNIKNYIHTTLIFTTCSLLSGCLAAVCLIPTFTSMTSISATGDAWPTSQYYNFTLIEFIYNHLSAVDVTVFKSDIINAPNISSSIIVIPLLILFLTNKKINIKTKIGYTLLLTLLILSFFWAPLDFIWHAFHVPNDLPYRYSFLYPFIMIIISAYSIDKIKDSNDITVLITFIISMIFVGSVCFIEQYLIKDKIVILNFIVLIIWYLIYVIYKYFNKKNYISFISIILVIIECTISINNNWNIDQNMNNFYSDYDNIQSNLTYIKNNDQDKFYRIEKYDMNTFNDPSWYNYYGTIAFSSMEYENFAKLQYNLGMPGNEINSFYYTNNTPIYNIMFNLKYIIGDINDNHYTLYYSDAINNNYIYKSNYSSSLMFGINNNITNWNYTTNNAIEIQNDFIYKAYNIDNILKKITIINDKILTNKKDIVHKYKIDSTSGYIYFTNNINSLLINGTLYIKDNYDYNISGNDYNYYNIVKISENRIIRFQDTNEIYISYEYENNNNLEAYEIDNTKINILNNYIDNNKVTIEEFKEYNIKGNYNGNTNFIYTSIPYDKNWKVYIDGKQVKTTTIGNSLLGFNITPGNHEIILKYEVPYLKTSICISTITILGLIIFYNRKKLIKQ